MDLLREMVAGVVAGLTFWFFRSHFPAGAGYLILSIAIMVVVFVVLRYFVMESDTARRLLITAGIDKKSRRELEAIISDAETKLEQIKRNSLQLPQGTVREQTAEICRKSTIILRYVRKNPLKIKDVSAFFEYHLDEVNRLLVKYIDAAELAGESALLQSGLADAEQEFSELNHQFGSQFDALAETTLLGLMLEVTNVQMRNGRTR